METILFLFLFKRQQGTYQAAVNDQQEGNHEMGIHAINTANKILPAVIG